MSTPPTTAVPGVETSYPLVVDDLNMPETFTYAVLQGPGAIDAMGVYTYTPDVADVGMQLVEIQVTDSDGLTANQEFTLTVAAGPDFGQALFQVTPTGGLNSSTFGANSFIIENTSTGGQTIESFTLDFSSCVLFDIGFDPDDGTDLGDVTSSCFTAQNGSAAVGVIVPPDPCVDPFSLPFALGYAALTVDFTDFQAGETFSFTVDVDPSSIQGSTMPGNDQPGAISGLELIGATVTVNFDNGLTATGQLWQVPGSLGGSQVAVKIAPLAAPTLTVPTAATMVTAGVPGTTAFVGETNQVAEITGPAGANASLVVIEGVLDPTDSFGGAGFDVDPFEINDAIGVTSIDVVLDATGFASVPFTLNELDPGSLYAVSAVIRDPLDVTCTSAVSNVVRLDFDPLLAPMPPAFTSTAPTSATAGLDLAYMAVAEDPEMAGVTYSIEGTAPMGLTIDPMTGLVTWIPSPAQAGVQMFTVRATDPDMLFADQVVTVCVDDPMLNSAPSITSMDPMATVGTGSTFTFTVEASDPDPCDTFTFMLTSAPMGATIDPMTGEISYLADTEGMFIFEAVATDNGGMASAPFSFMLTVEAPMLTALYRINCGNGSGQGAAYTDGMGNLFEADGTYQNGGNTFAVNASNDVLGTTDDPLYRSERFWTTAQATNPATNGYSFPVTPGEYFVRLHFAEVFTPPASTSGNAIMGPGERVFDVLIEGNVVLPAYDQWVASGGGLTATIEELLVFVADGSLDITVQHIVENPAIKAIEIFQTNSVVNALTTSPSSIDFGDVIVGQTSAPVPVTLGKIGSTEALSVTGLSVSGPFTIDPAALAALPQTLASETETFVVPVTFSPTVQQAEIGTLTIDHTGINSPTTVSLAGNGIPMGAPVTPSFSSQQVDPDIFGSNLNQPTTLDWGPDGMLYVAQQNGQIYQYEVVRNGPANYEIVGETAINDIQQIPNHDDDGSLSTQNNRQVTGLLATGTAMNPVLYVSSSDPRIGGGGNATDTGLDTNSGIISRLTWNGTSWDHVEIIRGLPRSRENHSTNGMDLDEVHNKLYIAQGGHTNNGAPSNNFTGAMEYALCSAILVADLDAIEAMPIQMEVEGGVTRQFILDLPTLDLPSVPGNDTTEPWGGRGGANMAIVTASSPVQIFSPGYRNQYDVVLTTNGNVYTYDNGPNGGWGGEPFNNGPMATNEFNDATGNVGHADNLHLCGRVNPTTGDGFDLRYGGHAVPIRSNAGAGVYVYERLGVDNFSLVAQYGPTDYLQPPVPAYNPIEGSKIAPPADGSIVTLNASTNGLCEYTASNFNGAMTGDLLAASFNGNIVRIQLGSDGETLVGDGQTSNFLSSGSQPLDVVAQGDGDLFPGTIWVANRQGGFITVYEPDDYDGMGGGPMCTGADDPMLDEDMDGFSNADEIANGTDPCSSASFPEDFDGDFISDLTDPDDDNDGIADVMDVFALDPMNGRSTGLPLTYLLSINSGEEIQGTPVQRRLHRTHAPPRWRDRLPDAVRPRSTERRRRGQRVRNRGCPGR